MNKTISVEQYGDYLMLRCMDQRLKVKYLNIRRDELLTKIRGGKYSGRNLDRYKALYREILIRLKEERAELKRRNIELFS